MPPERSQQLVFELDAWYRSHKVRQKDLAAELNMSPQQLSEILALRNRPTGEQALAINSFLESESQSMSTPVFEPKPDRPPRVDDPNQPRTLGAAKERIQELNAELQQLRSVPPGRASAQPTQARVATPTPSAAAAVKPTLPAAATSTRPIPTPQTAWEKEVARASAASLEGLSAKPLVQQTARELQAALNNAGAEDRGPIYAELKSREGDTAQRAFKEAHRK